MGYSPWGLTEPDTTEAISHVCRNLKSTEVTPSFKLSCSILLSFLAARLGLSEHDKPIAFLLFVFYLCADEQKRKKAFLFSSNTAPRPQISPSPPCFSSLSSLTTSLYSL